MTQNMRKKGVTRILEKQEQWNQSLGAGQGLVYTLLSLMPSQYQLSLVGAIPYLLCFGTLGATSDGDRLYKET